MSDFVRGVCIILAGCVINPLVFSLHRLSLGVLGWNALRRVPFVLTLALVLGLPRAGQTLELGANVNGEVCRLQRELLDKSHTTWVRVFLPASPFITGIRKVATDPQVALLKAVADSRRKVILSLKWNLRRSGWRTPAPGSPLETKWFSWVDELLAALAGKISLVSATNEIYPDTPAEDLLPNERGEIPYVRFMQRLVPHIKARNDRTPAGDPLPVYVGGFTRSDTRKMQDEPATRAILEWANNSSDVSGIDFHIHIGDLSQMENALRFVRSHLLRKPVIVTEFSAVWRYKEHLAEALGVSDRGRQFAQRYGLSRQMSVLDYINGAQANPVPQEQWQAFLASRDWFDPGLIKKAGALMERYGVAIATYSFSQGHPSRKEGLAEQARLTLSEPPWLLNPLFVGRVAKAAVSTDYPVNYGLFDDYVRWQEPTTKVCERTGNCPWAKAPQRPPFASRHQAGVCTF